MSKTNTDDHEKTLSAWLESSSTKETQPNDFKEIISQGTRILSSLGKTDEAELATGLQMADELHSTTTDPLLTVACILFPLFRDTKPQDWPQALTQEKALTELIKSTQRLCMHTWVKNQSSEDRFAQSTALRKMLLAMVDDIRVVLIKLCEQVTEVRELHKNPDPSKLWQAEIGLYVYATLANRLGLGQLKWRLEDLSFRYLSPDTYKEISKTLLQKRTQRESYVQTFKQILSELILKETKLTDYTISGRAKHIYSIYRKCKRKNHPYESINDATACRILVPTIADCYAVLGIIHEQWETEPEEFDDYISNPKPNGYRSLHTVIHGPDGILVEIQIRTVDMHEEAELGVAAHWKYKQSRSSTEQNKTTKINWLHTLLGWSQDVTKDEGTETFKQTFQDRTYVFSPKNKVIDLPVGATPLDFAYHIHTDVGHRCVGAKVNNAIKPLTYVLQTGDQVSILTQKNATPSRDWLSPRAGYIVSRHAKSKIRHYFRLEFYDSYLKTGVELWEKHLGDITVDKKTLHTLVTGLNFIKLPDLQAALGAGELHARTILNKLRQLQGNKTPIVDLKKPTAGTEHSNSPKKTGVIIEGVSNLMTQLAKCCHPLPGDAVMGYLTKSQGVSIHRENCINLVSKQKSKPERVVNAQWGMKQPASCPATLLITTENTTESDKALHSYLSSKTIKIISHHSQINKSRSMRHYRYELELNNNEQLKEIMNGLNSLSSVHSTQRS